MPPYSPLQKQEQTVVEKIIEVEKEDIVEKIVEREVEVPRLPCMGFGADRPHQTLG